MNNLTTLIFYFSIIFIASFFAFKGIVGIEKDGINKIYIDKKMIFISFLILWQLLAFSKCGTDYQSYNQAYLDALNLKHMILDLGFEPGFALFNFFLRCFNFNVIFYNIIISFLFLSLIYYSLYRMRKYINFGFGIFVFSCMFLIQFQNLKRIYLASAICLLAISYLIENKNKIYSLLILLASSFHFSAIIMFFPIIIKKLSAERIEKKKFKRIVFIFITILTSVVFLRYCNLVQFGKYERYLGEMDFNFGFAQILYHLPLFFILLKVNPKYKSLNVYEIFKLLVIESFLIGMTSYVFTIIGRMSIYFIFPYIFLSRAVEFCDYRYINKSDGIKIFRIIIYIYILLRFLIYFAGYYSLDSIAPYENIFGLKI